jgi:uncharacterized protein YoaH (UPF0181 family)
MKQTAVEWLINKLKSQGLLIGEPNNLVAVREAKEMEKQQIIDAYEDGYSDSDNTFELNKEYYNETFKNQ